MRASTVFPDTLFGPLLADRTPGRDAGRDRGEKGGLAGAVDAAGDGRVDGKPPGGNFLSAIDTEAVIARIEAAQRRIDERQARAAPRLHGLRHRLNLHGVHPRHAADTLLIERDRAALACRRLA